MPRPKYLRKICHIPEVDTFLPEANMRTNREVMIISLEEIEAIRLTDLDGLYQDEAASIMGISRQTIGRIIISAHKKIADAIINGKGINISGGTYILNRSNEHKCRRCKNKFKFTEKEIKHLNCPHCIKLKNIGD